VTTSWRCALVVALSVVSGAARAADVDLAEALKSAHYAKAPGYSEGKTWKDGDLFFCSGALLRVGRDGQESIQRMTLRRWQVLRFQNAGQDRSATGSADRLVRATGFTIVGCVTQSSFRLVIGAGDFVSFRPQKNSSCLQTLSIDSRTINTMKVSATLISIPYSDRPSVPEIIGNSPAGPQ
jgi:hypothetical protein